ncbi:hypothetical protein [Streptomyces sp. NPDC058989]|uniref:hypothetical protein n=1 Tax=Streptomyces sp. NPDC058989 TaxID=3346686 RepID=UPI00369BD1A3
MDDFESDDIAVLREQDLPGVHAPADPPGEGPVQLVALWQRSSGPAGHKPGARPSAERLEEDYRRAPDAPELCDRARCLAPAAPARTIPAGARCAAPRMPLRRDEPATERAEVTVGPGGRIEVVCPGR